VAPVDVQGRRLSRIAASDRASAQNAVGAARWIRRVRTQSFKVKKIRSAFPFCCEVQGHERKSMPCEDRKARMAAESNSLLLSVCKVTTNQRQHIRFQVYRERPNIMSKIIKQDKVIFES
jgi:hypothetical protein